MNKTPILLVVLVFLIGAGFFILNKKSLQNNVENETLTATTSILRIKQNVTTLGVTISPIEVLEDSRCPADVVCIQAGTVRVNAKLTSGQGTADQIFILNKPITTEAEEITLVQVDPYPSSTKTIAKSDYVFHFKISKRAE